MTLKKNWLNYIVAFFIIITINFLVPRMLPGNPLDAIYGDEVLVKLSEDARVYLENYHDMDKPIFIQYLSYVTSMFQGNLGYSFYHKKPIMELLLSYIPYTILLMGLAMFISTALAIILGIESGWRRGKKSDKIILFFVIFLSGFPAFFIGSIFLIVFGVILNAFPFQGARTLYAGFESFDMLIDFLRHLTLPLLSLIIIFLPHSYLLTRNSMVSNLKEPYILLAKAKGLKNMRIKYLHAGRNSIIPIATQTSIRFGTMILTGTLFIEIIFSYPGMGTLIYSSIANRDYPVLQGSFLFTAFLVLFINFLMDIFYVKLDPRIQ